jgi:hypothetical protein
MFKSRVTVGPGLLLGAALAACGGTTGDEAGPVATPPATSARLFVADTEYGPGARPGPTSAAPAPADAAAHTRPGLYLRRGAAERIDQQTRGEVVWLDTDAFPGDIDLAVLNAYGVQAAVNLGNDVPFLVTGGNQRLSARVVDRLAAEGIARAYLVTP